MSHAESEVVLCDDLAPIVEAWIEKANRRYKLELADCSRDQMVGPIGQLAFMSGVPERVIYRLRNYEACYVDLDVADALLMAIDHHISEVDVYKKKDVYHAAQELGKLTVLIAKCRGWHITNDRKNRKYALPAMRRKLYASVGAEA